MKRLDDSKGAPPLYLQISQILRDKILRHEYDYGDRIPSEKDLQDQYEVSRITARQAIQELEQENKYDPKFYRRDEDTEYGAGFQRCKDFIGESRFQDCKDLWSRRRKLVILFGKSPYRKWTGDRILSVLLHIGCKSST